MEVNRAESAAVAAVGGVPADVLDTAGRLVVTPNALTLDGQRNVPADLQPGESLASFLERHVPGIDSGAWTVMIGGAVVPQAMWVHTFPKHGQLIACRAVLRKSALQLVAIAALSYFTMGAGAGWIAGSFGVSAGVAGAIGLGMFMAGSVLINKVLAPKIPSAQSLAQKQIFSLSDQRNAPRPYEPPPTLWGEMRVTPDLASKSYAWYEGDDQYLSTILLGGINVHSAADLAIGDTPIGNYSDVSIYYNGFPGMPSQDVPLYSNVDAIAGAEFVNGGDWITRTGSAGTGALQLDIEGQLYDVDNKGNIKPNSVDLTIEARQVGSSAWATLASSTITNASTDVLRRTHSFDVAPGQYEVRAKLGVPRWNEGGSADACKFNWVSLKSVQADTTDYSQWGCIGIKIRASGQLSGSLDQVRATYRAKPMPIWTGTEWATATTRADGLSNPGAILLQALRGVWVTDSQGQRILQFGFGLSDEQIDIEGLKAFMLHCAARGYTYDKWVTSSMSLGAFCEEVALAGMGEFAWTDGSRPTAVFVSNGQPNSAVVNMANMLKGGFSVDYALSNAADGIEYQWLNRDTWEMTTLRVMAPGVTTMLSPARVTGEGVTSEQHAAVMARYHLAQSLYQYKTVHFTADIEHLDYRRLSVLSVSHDLTQWGFGGRVMAAERIGAQVRLTLDEPVPPLATAYIGLRVPGARDYRVWAVQPLAAESDVVTLVGEWPEDLDFPGEGIGNPVHDTLWCYDFKSTPGYRVRVTGIDPESDLKGARVTAVPEGPEFWDYVLNGTYVPAPNQSSIPQLGRPVVKNLRVSEKVNLQGDTEWYELSCIWDAEGDCDHAQVWAGRDGSELRMVDGNAQGARSTFRIDGAGEWLIVVRPFNANGQAGQSATLLYITTMTQLPPRNPGTFVVQQVEGGLRRFAWMYAGERPAAFAGVQIRYVPGDVPLSVADWDTMLPLGTADDVYAAQFETTKPDAGQWTFGLRAVDTAGQLADGVLRYVAVLDKVFENIREPDLTPPPAPTGVTAAPLMTTAQVNWASPTYTVGHGHDHSVIYAALWAAGGAAPAFSVAKSVGTEQGHPASIPVELGSKYTIWVTHVSVDGVESLPSAGVTFVTAQDVGKLLDVLEGKITESQLYTDLAKEIDLISGTGAGSVNARVLAEAQARAQAVAAEANARAQALASEAAARGQDVAAMAAELDAAANDLQARIDAVNAQVSDIIGASEFDPAQAYEAGQLVKYQNKLYRAKVNTVGNLPTNATYWDLVGDYASLGEAVAAHAAQLADHANRITQTEQGLTAEASARTTLAAQLRGNYTGSDVAQVTSGLVWSERQARVSGDSANATAIDAVKARMPTGTGKVASEASVIDEATARAAADAAAASRTTAIEARLPAGTGALATAAAVTALDTRVTAAEGVNTSQSTNITNLQNSITNGPVLPSDFSAGLVNWTGSRQGAPTTVNTLAGTIVADDADFGVCAQFNNWTSTGTSALTKGVMQAVPGRVYRVRARCKVMAAPSFPVSLGIIAGGNKADYTISGDSFGPVVSVPAAGQIVELTALFSNAAENAAGAVAWNAASVYLRFGLRLNLAQTTGLQLRVQSISIEEATADVANADATTALTSRVSNAEGNISSTSGALTTLTNRVTAAEGVNASQATAISGLQTSVTNINGTLTSQGSSITSLSNSLDALQGAGDNLLKASNVELVRAAGAYKIGSYIPAEALTRGEYYTLVACITHTPASGDTTSSVGAWVNGQQGIATNLVRNGNKVVATYTFGFNHATAPGTSVDFYYYPSTVTTGAATVHWACLYQGTVVPPKAWQPSVAELGQAVQGKADSSALTALASRVTNAEGNISSTSSALTTLTNRVTAAEGVNNSQATAIGGLQSSVTTINGTLSSQGSSITSLESSVKNIGGASAIAGGSFENALTFQRIFGAIVSTRARNGSRSFRAARNLGGESSNVYSEFGQVPAAGARTYYVEVWAQAEAPIATGTVSAGINGVRVGSISSYHTLPPVQASSVSTTEWTRISGYITTVADCAAIRGYVWMGAITQSDAVIYYDDFVAIDVTEGRQADIKSDANATAVTNLSSRVTTAEGSITSTSSALTALTNRVTAAEGVNTSQATAISGLNSSVTTINGTLTSQASQIGKLEASASGVNAPFASVSTWDFSSDAEGWTARGGTALITGGAFQFTTTTGTSRMSRSGLSIKGSDYDKIRARIRRVSGTVTYSTLSLFYVNAAHGLSNSFAGSVITPDEFKTGTGWVEVEWDMANLTLGGTDWSDGTTTTIELQLTNAGVASVVQVDWIAIGKRGAPASNEAVNAAVTTEATARANADTALASRATALESRMPTGTGQLATAAALTAVDTKVTNIDGRVTSESSRLDQVQAAVGSAAACLQALNPMGGESEWVNASGNAAATFVTAAEADARGGAVLTVGNATVNGEKWLRHVATIPMDENKLYKLSARVRRTAGDGGIYLGIAGLNAAKSLYVNTSNVETSAISSAHYAINNAKPALGTWQVVEYYFKGRAAGAATGSGTKAAPRVFANKVAHLALMIVGNYQGQVGFFDLDYITLEDVTAAEQASAAVATEATARATTDGYLGAQYSVRMQLSQGGQQVVGGFGISGTTSGTAGPQIDFGVMANSFWIAAPSGSPGGVSNVKPFVVQTTAQTVNGVSVPAGVYMDAAYINNVTALWARFGNLVADTIQATSISVTKLTGGSMSVGSYINSSNYVSGSTGWSINSNGQAEFSQVTVRGAIYSTVGTIGGITINGNGLNVGGFWSYAWPPAGQSGLHIGPYGILLGNANNGRYIEIQSSGNIYAPGLRIENGNATFSGNLSGASGSFSGVLTAQRVISMENLDYNIATVAVGVTAADLVGPVNGEVLGVTAPAADGNATYIVSFHADVGAGSAGALQIQVDGGTQFQFPMNTGGMKSFSFTFSGNGLTRRVRLYVANNNTSPASTVAARSISVIVSKR
ncbi:host specificity factor TipJ family phage tail protein [Comamonas testosteroni]|uniref:host specificity factor TipJ family phage tail protein n=1 Tax=Comamonas testosteroni TaxID=285 RepID=UPI0006A63078|nr:host specificity factor TipJ family phage tail protein [Comamonas testosteroni]KWT67785.1 Phage tail fiber protein [Comamonas testosteroni]